MSGRLTALAQLLARAEETCATALESERNVKMELEAARDALAAGRTADAERHIDAALGKLAGRSWFG